MIEIEERLDWGSLLFFGSISTVVLLALATLLRVLLQLASVSDGRVRDVTVLNQSQLEQPPSRASQCAVELDGRFVPVGTFAGQQVMRYSRQRWWWGFGQCPEDTLLLLDAEDITHWRERYATLQHLQHGSAR